MLRWVLLVFWSLRILVDLLTLLIDTFNYLCTHNISTHTHTQIVTASSLVGRPDIMKVDLLFQIFHDAFKYVHVYQCECFYIYTLIIATLGPCAWQHTDCTYIGKQNSNLSFIPAVDVMGDIVSQNVWNYNVCMYMIDLWPLLPKGQSSGWWSWMTFIDWLSMCRWEGRSLSPTLFSTLLPLFWPSHPPYLFP